MSPTHRRGNLLAIFLLPVLPEARDRRIAKIIEDPLAFGRPQAKKKRSVITTACSSKVLLVGGCGALVAAGLSRFLRPGSYREDRCFVPSLMYRPDFSPGLLWFPYGDFHVAILSSLRPCSREFGLSVVIPERSEGSAFNPAPPRLQCFENVLQPLFFVLTMSQI